MITGPHAAISTEHCRGLLIAIVLAMSLTLPNIAEAASGRQAGPWKLLLATEVLAPGNATRHLQSFADEAEALCYDLIQFGARDCSASVGAYGAFGARVGLLYNVSDKLSVGPTLGYLYGGPTVVDSKLELTAADGSVNGFSGRVENHTTRLVAEGKGKFPISQAWQLALGVGMGIAMDNEHIKCSDSGIFEGGCESAPNGANTGWFTWEMTPSVFFRSFEFGMRYMGFARGRQLPWNTWGGFIGYWF